MAYDYYGYEGLGSSAATGVGVVVWVIIALIAALVGCFLIYFMFVKKDNDLKNKKLEWLRSFLRFDKMLIEPILKICYIFGAIFTTLAPFAFLAEGFIGFLICLAVIIFGNILLRLIYEGSLIIIMIWKNTRDIKDSFKK